jgi:hypothetical protein
MKSLKPCPHMKTLLSALADGSLSGLARWYAENHAQRCPGCGSALTDLKTIRERLRTLGVPPVEGSLGLSEEHWSKLEAAWDKLDHPGT